MWKWPQKGGIYPHRPVCHITKYKKELQILREQLYERKEDDLSPLLPLLGFPSRDNAQYKRFET